MNSTDSAPEIFASNGLSASDSTQQIVYEFSRVSQLEGWWSWALLVGAFVALAIASMRLYRRDVVELQRPVRWTLIALRLASILALAFFFLDLQRRTERMVTRPSEVAILVDTSQSMSLPSGGIESKKSRAQRAADLLGNSPLLAQLENDHRVHVYAFDTAREPALLETRGGQPGTSVEIKGQDQASTFSSVAMMGAFFVGLGLILSLVSFLVGAAGRVVAVGYCVAGAAICTCVGIITLGSTYAVHSNKTLAELLGSESQSASDDVEERKSDAADKIEPIRVSDWSEAIAAGGTQSRIGDSIRGVMASHDASTLAGIVLITDGQNNGGVGAGTAIASARRGEVALYPLGLGSSDAPTNVRVVDLDAPRRVYPGDKFAITAMLQASGPKDLEVEVQLLDRLSGENETSNDAQDDQRLGEVVDSRKVSIKNDGTLTDIRFEMEPKTVGRRKLAIRVVAPTGDQNEQDNVRDARYEVVGKKLRVLAVAGGPTREYRFVRNLLFRDNSIELDVWLQTGKPGMSQDADGVLQAFPNDAEALFEYDAIILFDPDWTAISASSLDLLDRWLSQQAGGMMIVAGPVYHPRWIRLRTDPRVSRIAGFFPVTLSNRGALLSGGRQGGENAWPLDLSPETRRADFMWIAETPAESLQVWENFDGVYDFVGVKNAKPGAKVYARFSDPTTEVGGSQPVYLASHFYGAGRVVFQGSGEMWRLRGESDGYFDSYYTKIVRWISEGRLMRDSNRGLLLVDNSRAMVGQTISVRAILTDEQFEPLNVPEVDAKVLAPGGRIEDLKLLPLKGEPRPGTYGGRFTVREAGSYELRLTLGDALEEQVLRQSVQVRLPTVELERPRRNDAELEQMAAMTGGKYFAVDESVIDESLANTLTSTLHPQPQTTILPGTPDMIFGQRRNLVLMWLIATMLTMEWVTRRLHRLA